MTVFLIALLSQTVPPEIAKWEDDIVEFEQRDQTEASPDDAILFYGSSSIRLWDTIAEDMAPWPVVQRGYGGARLTDAAHYADRVLGPRLGSDNPRRPRAIVIFLANDITGSSETDASPGEVLVRFRRLHDYIRAEDATVPVFWIEVTPTGKRWKQWPEISEATAMIKDRIEGSPNTYLIPTAGAILGADGRPRDELFVDDRLHLNEDGYDVWASLIKAKLHSELGAAVPAE